MSVLGVTLWPLMNFELKRNYTVPPRKLQWVGSRKQDTPMQAFWILIHTDQFSYRIFAAETSAQANRWEYFREGTGSICKVWGQGG